jgi:hypothetical protein
MEFVNTKTEVGVDLYRWYCRTVQNDVEVHLIGTYYICGKAGLSTSHDLDAEKQASHCREARGM